MTKDVKHVIVSYEEAQAEDFKAPAKYRVNAAIGVVFFLTRDRKAAQEACNELLGKGKYTVSAGGAEKPKSGVTCKSSLNSASQKGMRFLKQKSNWGAGE